MIRATGAKSGRLLDRVRGGVEAARRHLLGATFGLCRSRLPLVLSTNRERTTGGPQNAREQTRTNGDERH